MSLIDNSESNNENIESTNQSIEENTSKSELEYAQQQNAPRPSRGALKLEVSTSTPVVAAGSEFSIFVVIRNPFPVPVTIYSTKTHIPVELSDEISRQAEKSRIKLERKDLLQRTDKWHQKILKKTEFFVSDLAKQFKPDAGPRVAVAVSTDSREARARTTPVYIYGDVGTEGGDFVGRDYLKFDFGNRTNEEMRQALFEIEEFTAGRKTILLRPGDSVVNHFVIKTTKWLMFTPIAHTFQIQVRYDVDGEDHLDTIPYNLNIRAATASSMVGAVIGGVLGSIVSNSNKGMVSQEFPRVIFTSVIFAVIVVIAFSRKSNVQQIVSVEDFWGGIFIGFLVGYSGESFVQSVLSVGNLP
jgi:hypothetical protein